MTTLFAYIITQNDLLLKTKLKKHSDHSSVNGMLNMQYR
jgi:hypothetical protein